MTRTDVMAEPRNVPQTLMTIDDVAALRAVLDGRAASSGLDPYASEAHDVRETNLQSVKFPD
jgi:hypothetical protein